MADIHLSKKETSLVLAGRTADAQPTIGDLFVGINDFVSDNVFNAIRDSYISLETSISDTYSDGFVAFGKGADDIEFEIGDDPDHPNPPRK